MHTGTLLRFARAISLGPLTGVPDSSQRRWGDNGPVVGREQHYREDLASAATSATKLSAREEAKYIVYSLLSQGPLLAEQVRKRQLACVSLRTLHRAKAELKVKSIKRGDGKDCRWYWRLLPDDPAVRAFREHDLGYLMERL